MGTKILYLFLNIKKKKSAQTKTHIGPWVQVELTIKTWNIHFVKDLSKIIPDILYPYSLLIWEDRHVRQIKDNSPSLSS
jgi:hypothetical protein